MNVTVTQADIDSGERKACDLCPIALAVIRVKGKVDVSYKDVVYRGPNPQGIYVAIARAMLPEVARKFIQDFDAGLPVKPITFPLEWMAEGKR